MVIIDKEGFYWEFNTIESALKTVKIDTKKFKEDVKEIPENGHVAYMGINFYFIPDCMCDAIL